MRFARVAVALFDMKGILANPITKIRAAITGRGVYHYRIKVRILLFDDRRFQPLLVS